MEPMNAEAQAITDKLKSKWVHPVESLSTTYGDVVLQSFEQQLKDAMGKAFNAAQPAQPGAVSSDVLTQMKAMQEQLNLLMEQNAKLQAKNAGETILEGDVDELEPLPDIDVPPPIAASTVPLKRQPPINRPPQVADRR
jgi:hypothetical protein